MPPSARLLMSATEALIKEFRIKPSQALESKMVHAIMGDLRAHSGALRGAALGRTPEHARLAEETIHGMREEIMRLLEELQSVPGRTGT